MNNKNNIKIILITLLITFLISMPTGIIIGSNIKIKENKLSKEEFKDEKRPIEENESSKDDTKNQNSVTDEIDAEELVKKFHIAEMFNDPEIQTNDIILDENTKETTYISFYTDVEKVLINEWYYATYDKFNEAYQEVFNKVYEPKVENLYLINNLHKSENRYVSNEITSCTIDKLKQCYIVLPVSGLEWYNTTLSDLKLKDNIITGNMSMLPGKNNAGGAKKGTFEFSFIKENSKYYVDYLKVTKIENC